MVDWNEVKCNKTCKSNACNRKGKPSVVKGSGYCQEHYGVLSSNRLSLLQRLRKKMKERRGKRMGIVLPFDKSEDSCRKD